MNDVLWVEDSPDHWLLMELALEGTTAAGHYDIAASVGEAVEKARDRAAEGAPYRVVAVDVQLPGGTGWDVVEALQEHGHHDTTFVVVSASNDARDVGRSHALGCEHVTKPLGLDAWSSLGQRLVEAAAAQPS